MLGTFASVVGASAALASADVAEDGLWYLNALGVPDVHASGITGEGVTIAVIDSPINLDVPTLQGADIELQDSFCMDESGDPMPGFTTDVALGGHGTNVVSLLVGTGEGYPGQVGTHGVAPGATVLYYPTYLPDEATCHDVNGEVVQDTTAMGRSITDAVAQGADIVSVSLAGGNYEPMEEPIAEALREGVIIVAGLSNGPQSLDDDIFSGLDGPPAIMNGVLSVLSAGADGNLQITGIGDPNTSEIVDVVGPGVDILVNGYSGNWDDQDLAQGTSLATPIVAGNLALAVQKYPEATTNQILQSMIHNTGTEGGHDATWSDEFGYGFVVTQTLLAADPTEYPDVNPLIAENWPWSGPQIAQIFGEDYQTASPSPSPTMTSRDDDQDNGRDRPPVNDNEESSSLLPLIIIAAVVLVLVIGAIVAIAVVSSRKSGKGAHGGQV